ncbi:MAG: hypothetical protein ACT4O1_17570 [Gemmatimonadota bacterium]
MFRTTIALVVISAALPLGAQAQTTTLDEGAFRITIGGKEVGTETFSIRQNGSGEGAVIIAVGRVVLGAESGPQELSSELQVGGRTLRPAAYEVRVQGDAAERITGRVVGSRFSAQIVSPAGESMREYLAGDGAVLTDDGVAHHYYFLARRIDSGTARIPVIIPRQSRQVTAEVTVTGSERITVGNEALEARRISIKPAGGAERIVWVDQQGRVLRVEIPSVNFVAQRVDAP